MSRMTIKFRIMIAENGDGIEMPEGILDFIRNEARKGGWALVAGYKEFVKKEFNGTLRSGKYGDITSLSFNNEKDYYSFMYKVHENV